MAKTAYLVVSDLHEKYSNFRNRVDYRTETQQVKIEMIKCAKGFAQRGYEVVLLLLGDVFHNSYKDIFTAVNDNNFFHVWRKSFGEVYSVLGNHELTYYKSNPFYTLVSEIESEKVTRLMNKVWTPVGLSPVIRVVDELVDGEVHFYFNHYDTGITQPEGNGVNIGLFHQKIVHPQIVEQMRRLYQATECGVTVESEEVWRGYDVCFLGHMHQVYGVWRTEAGTRLYYLASLGRTNEREVSDCFLERNIPAVLVEDGKFKTVEDHKFNLASRAECIREEIVERNREAYTVKKEVQEIKQSVPGKDAPVQNLYALFAEDAPVRRALDELLVKEQDSLTREILRKTEVLVYENVRN